MTRTGSAEALHRDAATLLETYRAGAWTPAPEEHALAESLARNRWSGTSFRAALRDVAPAVRSGRLIDVLEPAVDIFDQAAVDVPADVVLQLREQRRLRRRRKAASRPPSSGGLAAG